MILIVSPQITFSHLKQTLLHGNFCSLSMSNLSLKSISLFLFASNFELSNTFACGGRCGWAGSFFLVLHLDQNKGPETYQHFFYQGCSQLHFWCILDICDPQYNISGTCLQCEKVEPRKVLARRKLSDSFQSGSNRGDFQRTLALI